MKIRLLAVYLVAFALVESGIAQGAASSAENRARCSPAQIKQLAREARTHEQCDAVAACYEKLEKNDLRQAAEEKQEWKRRSRNVTVSAAKYPRPVDSARNLYEYYLSKASEEAELSARYSRIAAQESPAKTR